MCSVVTVTTCRKYAEEPVQTHALGSLGWNLPGGLWVSWPGAGSCQPTCVSCLGHFCYVPPGISQGCILDLPPTRCTSPGLRMSWHLCNSKVQKKEECLGVKSACMLSRTLFDAMGCSPPGSSVHGILQARILEWVAMPSARGPSRLRGRTRVSCNSCIVGEFFIH